MTPTELKQLAAHAGGTFLPVLANIHVYATPAGNRAQVGNGRYWVDIPTTFPVLTANGDRLVAAVNACKGELELKVAATLVTVKDTKVRARIQLDPTEYPLAAANPALAASIPGIGGVLTRLAPFVATDASKAWATSICVNEGFAYATNNVSLARYPLEGRVSHKLNIPAAVVVAVTERGEITGIGYAQESITFHYADGSWVKSLLIAGDWPTGVVDKYIADLADDWEDINPGLSDMLATAGRISGERTPVVQFNGNGLALTDDTFAADDLEPVPPEGRVSAKMAAMVTSQTSQVQWHSPKKDVHAFRRDELICILGGTR